ncbi:MAG: class I SAM-dependent methyltransferase [Nitrospirota bacterium]
MAKECTYDPSYFKRLKKIESKHFWFNVRRKWIFNSIKKFVLPPARILEVGCGTGNVSSFLAEKGYLVTGCEYYREAIDMAWPGFRKVQGDAKYLPFSDSTFDIVGLFDVLEHFDDDIEVMREAIRVIRKNGIIIITVPAKEELWSFVDVRAFHKRRYTKEMLKKILSEGRLNPLLIEYIFMSLYIPMKYLRRKEKESYNQFQINGVVNTIMKGIFNMERIASRGVPLPIGTSLIAVAKRI